MTAGISGARQAAGVARNCASECHASLRPQGQRRQLASFAALADLQRTRLRASAARASSASSSAPCKRSNRPSTPLLRHQRGLATASSVPPHKDIVIVGAGPVGLSVACGVLHSAKAQGDVASGYPSITVVEGGDLTRLRSWRQAAEAAGAAAAAGGKPVPWENRVISLNAENMAWLRDIGVAEHLVWSRIRPVKGMRVWDGVSDATIDFHADEVYAASAPGEPAPSLSYMIEISNLQQGMLAHLEAHGAGQVEVRDKTRVERIEQHTTSPAEGEPEAYADLWPTLHLGGAESAQSSLLARLLIGADGPNSPVRQYAGIANYGWAYGRKGVVGTLRCMTPADPSDFGNTAWQRFLPTGPIAFLPLEGDVGSMVWTLPMEHADAVQAMHRATPTDAAVQPFSELVSAAFRLPWKQLDAIFARILATRQLQGDNADWSWVVPAIADAVQQAGGLEALPDHGNGFVPPPVRSIDARSVASFPLQLKHADAYLGASLNHSKPTPGGGLSLPSVSQVLSAGLTAFGFAQGGAGANAGRGRTALVGDAAHSIHPQAGQGLNLGLADARSLTDVLTRAIDAGADLGSYTALKAYPRERYWENQKMLSAVDHLHWLYASPVPAHLAATPGASRVEGALRSIAREGVARSILWARSTGLEVVNELGPLKNMAMRQAGAQK